MYTFEYAHGKAIVYRNSETWGKQEVARFSFGVDAQEYVNFKNTTSTRSHSSCAVPPLTPNSTTAALRRSGGDK